MHEQLLERVQLLAKRLKQDFQLNDKTVHGVLTVSPGAISFKAISSCSPTGQKSISSHTSFFPKVSTAPK